MRYNLHRLSSKNKNSQWLILCELIGPVQQKFEERTTPSGQEDVRRRYGVILLIGLRVALLSDIFFEFRLQCLFPVSEPEKMAWRTEI